MHSPKGVGQGRIGQEIRQLALFAPHDYAFITDPNGDTLVLEADDRRHAEIESAISSAGWGSNHQPSGKSP